MNKKGDIQSIIYTVVAVFTIGVVLFFMSHLFMGFYDGFQNVISNNEQLNSSGDASRTLAKIQHTETNSWDYAFLGILIGYVILIGIFAYSTPISPVFFWIAVLMGLFGLFIGVMLSNTWMQMIEQPAFEETYGRFPITTLLLGSYYPSVITFILIIGLVLLFAKPGQGGVG